MITTENRRFYIHVNEVVVAGRLTSDTVLSAGHTPETTRTWGRLAVGTGNDINFILFVCWGKQAILVNQFYKKGKLIVVQGELRTRTTEGYNSTYETYSEINVRRISFGPVAVELHEAVSTTVHKDPYPEPECVDELNNSAVGCNDGNPFKDRTSSSKIGW